MKPTLDILIPHYNDPAGLSLSISSIYQQSWDGRIRIVVIDDGSSSEELNRMRSVIDDCASLYGHEDRITFFLDFNNVNRGRPYTRNSLLDAINSEYVAWIDAGDEWYKDKLAVQFQSMHSFDGYERGGVPRWITCNYDWQWTGGVKKLRHQIVAGDQHKELLSGKHLRAYLWTILGSAEAFKCVGYFDERLPRLQDLDYFIRFVSHGGLIETVGSDAAYCLYHKSDAGRDADVIRACGELIYEKHRVIYNRYGDAFRRKCLYDLEMLSARFAVNNGDQRKSKYFLWQACKIQPLLFFRHVTKHGITP